ncbi:hypothetical protein Pint_18242 [Pistacia integerrima]|uniref:Uncharacterized protein n=1 Tax=Pistacia integerrima TaxID=434235 RepID=A0ACC0YYY3_9ROSI|nr:hypothetical protein Pint_18242 [Pistacia integerrima]
MPSFRSLKNPNSHTHSHFHFYIHLHLYLHFRFDDGLFSLSQALLYLSLLRHFLS